MRELAGQSVFNFENVFAGNYLISIDPDESAFPRSLSGYYEEAVFWEDADTIAVSSDLENLDITVSFLPIPETGGASILGILEFETTVNSRFEERTRVANARVTVRRSTSTSRGLETGFVLVGERFTNANGEFTFSDLPPAFYRLRFDIPGIPTNETRNVDLDLRERTESNVIATIVDGQIVIEEVIALQADNTIAMIHLYPNPATDIVTLVFSNQGDWVYSIVDLQGKEIKKGSITTNDSQRQISLELRDWQNGLYLINYTHEGQRYQAKLVIRR